MSEIKEEVKNLTQKDGKKPLYLVAIIALLIIIIILLLFKSCSTNDGETTPNVPVIDTNQGVYVKPETPIDRSKNVTLPGWGSYTIPANETHITKGFEFHNPEQNVWYEISIKYNDTFLEKLIVDSGNKATAEHYAKLAEIVGNEYKFKSWDEDVFNVDYTEDGIEYIEAIGFFDDESERTIVIEVDGVDYEFKATCAKEMYVMDFTLCLEENDEVLFKSGAINPGNYLQVMDMNRALEAGEYKAYVIIQPYRSDGSKTNTGKVVLDLFVK